MKRILAINPGATSTKLAVYDEEKLLLKRTIEHQGQELKDFARVYDQYEYRLKLIQDELAGNNIALDTLKAIAGRGGILKPLSGGTYKVNELMVNDLIKAERSEHASNLGAVLAFNLGQQLGIPAFIVDPVSVDELEAVARISGSPDLPRVCMAHALNSKAVARKVAQEAGKKYTDCNLIVAHLGTGISVSVHQNGRMIDVFDPRQEGPFSPDRCGGLPSWSLVKLCYSGKYTEEEMLKRIQGSGGMFAYLGTKDVREAEKRASDGDGEASLVLDAMAYQVAKDIGAGAAVLKGDVDRIILTGGIAYSQRIVDAITARVKFIAPVVVVAGEEELESLAAGALRVLLGEEEPKIYI